MVTGIIIETTKEEQELYKTLVDIIKENKSIRLNHMPMMSVANPAGNENNTDIIRNTLTKYGISYVTFVYLMHSNETGFESFTYKEPTAYMVLHPVQGYTGSIGVQSDDFKTITKNLEEKSLEQLKTIYKSGLENITKKLIK